VAVASEGFVRVLADLLAPLGNQRRMDLVFAGDGGDGLSGLDLGKNVELDLAGEPSTLLGYGFSLLCLVEPNRLSQIWGPGHPMPF
jgi:hypothetical protein